MKPISVTRDYIGQVIAELKKVTHPTPSQVINRTILVLVSIGIATLLITVVDAGVTEILKTFIFKGE